MGEQGFVSRIFDGDFRQSQHSGNLRRGGRAPVGLLSFFFRAIASAFDAPYVVVVSHQRSSLKEDHSTICSGIDLPFRSALDRFARWAGVLRGWSYRCDNSDGGKQMEADALAYPGLGRDGVCTNLYMGDRYR